jgi:hypothetical protein
MVPNGMGNGQLEFVTMTGQVAHRKTIMIQNGKGNTDVSFLRPGLYVVRLLFGGHYYIEKLVVSGG